MIKEIVSKQPEFKKCTACKQIKSVKEFHTRRERYVAQNGDLHLYIYTYSQCKDCKAKWALKYRQRIGRKMPDRNYAY